MRVRAPLWARERISSALRSIVCKLLTIFHLSTVVPAFSRPWAPPRYPSPNSPPSGRGLWCPDGPYHPPPPLRGCPQRGDWGKTPRPPPVTVFPLRRRFPFFDRTRACIGPIGGPIQAFFALFAGIGPINGPIRAPLGETREESDSQHVASNKNGLYCSLRNAPARRRERFQGFLLLAGGSGTGVCAAARTTLTFSLYFRETGSFFGLLLRCAYFCVTSQFCHLPLL